MLAVLAITEGISLLKMLPDKSVIEDISSELGIAPAFVEKDWFAVQLLVLVSERQVSRDVKMAFSGGTSLSKGYGLIKRFSEDLDFILTLPEGTSLSAGQRRVFRKKVVKLIQSDERFRIDETEVLRGDSHRFFKIPIKYSRIFEDSPLRPHLQLEMTFMDLKQPFEKKTIQSIVSEVMQSKPELAINCVSAIETAGDKLSALTWRILIRNRNDKKDDPTLIRHLHDLAALENMIVDSKDAFISSAHASLEQDQSRRGGDIVANMSIADRLSNALKTIKEDDLYQKEYVFFVENMSYAAEAEQIGFEKAVQALERIINLYNQRSQELAYFQS